MPKFQYFELNEFIASTEAKERNIDNTPTFETVEHLSEFVGKFLEPLRVAYGKPITITSGYRCEKLNKAVGGVSTSAHLRGYAADITSEEGASELFNFITEWVKSYGVKFDQIFLEKKGATKWVHIGYRNNSGWQRGMVSTLKASE